MEQFPKPLITTLDLWVASPLVGKSSDMCKQQQQGDEPMI